MATYLLTKGHICYRKYSNCLARLFSICPQSTVLIHLSGHYHLNLGLTLMLKPKRVKKLYVRPYISSMLFLHISHLVWNFSTLLHSTNYHYHF